MPATASDVLAGGNPGNKTNFIKNPLEEIAKNALMVNSRSSVFMRTLQAICRANVTHYFAFKAKCVD